MASYNKVILMGNLTRDPELKFLQSGTPVVNFAVATSESWTDKQTGEKREEVCFVDLEALGRQAEVISEYFSRGKPILVEGRLKFDQWETEDGQKRSKHRVKVDRFSFVGGRQDEDAGDFGLAKPGSEQSSSSQPDDSDSTDDDIPF